MPRTIFSKKVNHFSKIYQFIHRFSWLFYVCCNTFLETTLSHISLSKVPIISWLPDVLSYSMFFPFSILKLKILADDMAPIWERYGSNSYSYNMGFFFNVLKRDGRKFHREDSTKQCAFVENPLIFLRLLFLRTC